MSRRAAVAAFDALSADDWHTIKPKRISRAAFREALADGRVDPGVLMRNIAVAARIADIEDELNDALDSLEAMPLRKRASVDMRTVLEVVV